MPRARASGGLPSKSRAGRARGSYTRIDAIEWPVSWPGHIVPSFAWSLTMKQPTNANIPHAPAGVEGASPAANGHPAEIMALGADGEVPPGSLDVAELLDALQSMLEGD